jgi:hypothetical protein
MVLFLANCTEYLTADFRYSTITNCMEHSPSWDTTGPQLVKNFLASYGTQWFITTHTIASFEPDQSSPCSSSHFSKGHFNIIFPSMPKSSKWSLSLMFFHQNPVFFQCCFLSCKNTSSNNGSKSHFNRGSLSNSERYLLYKRKLFELWLVQNLESHTEICLKITDFTSSVWICIFVNQLHCK